MCVKIVSFICILFILGVFWLCESLSSWTWFRGRAKLDVVSSVERALSVCNVQCLYNIYGYSALLVLNRTSLYSDSALLALNWEYSLMSLDLALSILSGLCAKAMYDRMLSVFDCQATKLATAVLWNHVCNKYSAHHLFSISKSHNSTLCKHDNKIQFWGVSVNKPMNMCAFLSLGK